MFTIWAASPIVPNLVQISSHPSTSAENFVRQNLEELGIKQPANATSTRRATPGRRIVEILKRNCLESGYS